MMNDILQLALALAAGASLGAVFFGGLWLTLQQLPTTRWPVRLALGSLIGRTGVTLLGFYLVINGNYQRLLVCVLGFILMRQLLIHWLHPTQTKPRSLDQSLRER